VAVAPLFPPPLWSGGAETAAIAKSALAGVTYHNLVSGQRGREIADYTSAKTGGLRPGLQHRLW